MTILSAIPATPAWRCARCTEPEEENGGPAVAICRHVAAAGRDEDEEMVIFTDRGANGVDTKHCGDRGCLTVRVCIGCWDNLYASEEDGAAFIARAFGEPDAGRLHP